MGRPHTQDGHPATSPQSGQTHVRAPVTRRPPYGRPAKILVGRTQTTGGEQGLLAQQSEGAQRGLVEGRREHSWPPPSPCKRRANRRHTTTTNPPKPTTSSPSAEAKRYKARDAHEAFFRPLTESPRKRNRHAKHKRPKCKKSRSLTDKERQEAARLHWDLNHDMPEILGHTATAQPRTDLTMAPIHFNELMEYFDNETMHQDNLKNLSDLLDDI